MSRDFQPRNNSTAQHNTSKAIDRISHPLGDRQFTPSPTTNPSKTFMPSDCPLRENRENEQADPAGEAETPTGISPD
jgi:hypothetical protein